jgi:hypothetical protein
MAVDVFYRSRLIHDTPLNNFAAWTLQPVRYLAGQRDICIVDNKIRTQTPLHYKYTQESWAKTAQMVAFLIPSLILGTVAQAINCFVTPEIRATFTLPPESSSLPPPSPFKGRPPSSAKRGLDSDDEIGFSVGGGSTKSPSRNEGPGGIGGSVLPNLGEGSSLGTQPVRLQRSGADEAESGSSHHDEEVDGIGGHRSPPHSRSHSESSITSGDEKARSVHSEEDEPVIGSLFDDPPADVKNPEEVATGVLVPHASDTEDSDHE